MRFRPTRLPSFLLLGILALSTGTGITGCEDDPILTPDENGGGAGGSYGTIKIAIDPPTVKGQVTVGHSDHDDLESAHRSGGSR